MSLTCQCPAAASLPTIPNMECAQSFGQIQKVAFMRLRDEDGNLNHFTPASGSLPGNPIVKLASWETFLAAEDGTKIVVSPFINSPADGGGDARMTGGGNDDLGGIPDVLGANPVQFTGSLRSIPQAIAKALKQMQCEANAGNLGVFLFDDAGNIECLTTPGEGLTTIQHFPIPIRALFVGDKIHGNFDAKDSNPISWYYPEGYSDNLVIIKPEFNPLTALQNAE